MNYLISIARQLLFIKITLYYDIIVKVNKKIL